MLTTPNGLHMALEAMSTLQLSTGAFHTSIGGKIWAKHASDVDGSLAGLSIIKELISPFPRPPLVTCDPRWVRQPLQ
jgi:hypothetical protein